jgi:MFS family permease
VKRFGEASLVIAGAFLFSLSLLLIPLAGPHTGLFTLLAVGAIFALGNSLATPSLTGLASKSVGSGEQGGVLGVTQSTASLARTVGPLIASALIYSAAVNIGFDQKPHHMSVHSLRATFWTAAGIMFAAFLLALYFARVHAGEYKRKEIAEAV